MSSPDLLAFLRDYQRREVRKELADYARRLRAGPEELAADPDVVYGARLLGPDPDVSGAFLYSMEQGELRFDERSRICGWPLGADGADPASHLQRPRIASQQPFLRRFSLLTASPPPAQLILIGAPPPNLERLEDAIADFCSHPGRHRAANDFFRRVPSRLHPEAEQELIQTGLEPPLDSIIRHAAGLDHSHFTIQGPPGTGKTYTGARLILELALQGRRSAILAQSHRAIDNLLLAAEQLFISHGLHRRLRFARSRAHGLRAAHYRMTELAELDREPHRYALLAGTIYQLIKLPPDIIDTLIIEEAGQIPLAWALAAGRLARNIVLLGDQQQLPQVLRSAHPGGAQVSCLEHLLPATPVVPPDFGAFLHITRRMNGPLTRLVSSLMYEDRLQAHPQAQDRRLDLPGLRHPALDSAPLTIVEIRHQGCSRSSPQEAGLVRDLVEDLHHAGLPASQIMIITPYRAQENLIRSLVPAEFSAQIGTVDRFQGREAEIVIFSMSSSDSASIPRDMEFLLSSRRLNVAISRARSKVIIILSPALYACPPSTLAELHLVNRLCRLRHSARTEGSIYSLQAAPPDLTQAPDS